MLLEQVEKEDIRSILSSCHEDMRRLEGSTILVTGASGFLARYLVETFLEWSHEWSEGSTLLMAGRDPPKLAEMFRGRVNGPNVRLIDSSRENWEKEISPECDYIVHFASPSDPSICQDDPVRLFDSMVESTEEVIELAKRSGTKRLLYLSSGAVYGTQPPSLDLIPETFPRGRSQNDATSWYAEGKRTCEVLVKYAGVPFVIARGFSFSGPHQNLGSSFAIPDFIRQASTNGSIRIRGDGRAIRSYCYEADAAIILWRLLLRKLNHDVYNVGSDRFLTSIAGLAEIVSKNLGNVPIVIEGKPEDGPPPRYVPDCGRQREVHDPGVNLEEGIARSIASMRSRGVIPGKQETPRPSEKKGRQFADPTILQSYNSQIESIRGPRPSQPTTKDDGRNK